MKRSSKIIFTLLVGATLTTMSSKFFAVESKETIEKKILSGKDRYETAIKVSSKWDKADNVILINSMAIADGLSAAPFAKHKDAPILLTDLDKLSESTKKRIKELGAKNIFIVGGEGVISKKVVKEIEALGTKVERISGKNRYETSAKIAKQLNSEKVAVVNGITGLADALSVAAPAAANDMAILLTDGSSLGEVEGMAKGKEAFVIGGEAVVSEALVKELNAERLSGKNRSETNVKIMEKFYDKEDVKELYIAKDGSTKENELIDALALGSLAGKEGAPIILTGNDLDEAQKNYLRTQKNIRTIYEIGGSLKENVIRNIVNILNGKEETSTKPTENNGASIKPTKDSESSTKPTKGNGGSMKPIEGNEGPAKPREDNGGTTKPTEGNGESTKPNDSKEENNNKNLIDRNKSSIMEVHFVYYAVLSLNEGNIDNCKVYIDGDLVKPEKVNTSGTILKVELKDSNKKKIKVVKGDLEDNVTLELKI
ncbi:cell wall-binding repeat-containing protein [Clostridium sp. Marseille-QA1073]